MLPHPGACHAIRRSAAHRILGLRQRAAGVDDMIGAPALFAVGRLQFEDVGEFLFGHPGPGEYALALGLRRGRHHHRAVDHSGTAFFEQQRDVEHDQRRARMFDQEGLAPCRDRRVDQRLEPGQLRGIAEHQRTELFARYAVRIGAAGKGLFDRRYQFPSGALQRADFGVGIENRYAGRLEHRRDRRFAHADRPGEPYDKRTCHAPSLSRNAASSPRGGATLKKWVKAAAACPISIARPSMVANPAARAPDRNGVSTGSVTMS